MLDPLRVIHVTLSWNNQSWVTPCPFWSKLSANKLNQGSPTKLKWNEADRSKPTISWSIERIQAEGEGEYTEFREPYQAK